MNNLFRSIIEMAIPGFMMFLFQGFESKFFDEMASAKDKGQDQEMQDEMDDDQNEDEFDDGAIFGYDSLTD
jgi:hypothetical protein